VRSRSFLECASPVPAARRARLLCAHVWIGGRRCRSIKLPAHVVMRPEHQQRRHECSATTASIHVQSQPRLHLGQMVVEGACARLARFCKRQGTWTLLQSQQRLYSAARRCRRGSSAGPAPLQLQGWLGPLEQSHLAATSPAQLSNAALQASAALEPPPCPRRSTLITSPVIQNHTRNSVSNQGATARLGDTWLQRCCCMNTARPVSPRPLLARSLTCRAEYTRCIPAGAHHRLGARCSWPGKPPRQLQGAAEKSGRSLGRRRASGGQRPRGCGCGCLPARLRGAPRLPEPLPQSFFLRASSNLAGSM
jgi:hypothetical protein